MVGAVWINQEKFPFIKGFIRFTSVTTVIFSILFVLASLGVRTASFQLDSFTALGREHQSRFNIESSSIVANATLWGRRGSILSSGYQYTSLPLTSDWIKSGPIESIVSKIIYEMGFLGLIIYFLFFGSVIYYSGKIAYRLKVSQFSYIALTIVVIILMFILKSIIHYGAGDDAFILIPFWLLVGILFKLSELSQRDATSSLSSD